MSWIFYQLDYLAFVAKDLLTLVIHSLNIIPMAFIYDTHYRSPITEIHQSLINIIGDMKQMTCYLYVSIRYVSNRLARYQVKYDFII
jgi:hypothetical protein